MSGLMEEPPNGFNHGRTASTDPEGEGRRRWVALDVESAQLAEFMRSGGFSIVVTSHGHGSGRAYGSRDAGMSAHRGVVDPDAYIDAGRLQQLVEEGLGFSYEQLEYAYGGGAGRPSGARSALMARIDARLLELARNGGNMLVLARAIGWPVREDKGDCQRMNKALARARAAEKKAA